MFQHQLFCLGKRLSFNMINIYRTLINSAKIRIRTRIMWHEERIYKLQLKIIAIIVSLLISIIFIIIYLLFVAFITFFRYIFCENIHENISIYIVLNIEIICRACRDNSSSNLCSNLFDKLLTLIYPSIFRIHKLKSILIKTNNKFINFER